MAIEEALTTLLAGVAGGRRNWGHAENISASAGPYLVLNRVSGVRDYTMGGASGYIFSRFQIDAYAETYGAARDTAIAAKSALSGYRGTQDGTVIQGIFVEGPNVAPVTDAGEVSHLSRQRLDAIVHHDE